MGYSEDMDWSLCKAVDRDPERLGGLWCFAGTRMPVYSLFEHLDKGSTVDEFLEWFPGTPPDLVHEVLSFAQESLQQRLTAA